MNTSVSALLLLLALLWPLLLAVTAAFRLTYPVAVRLLPWGALPALLATLLPDTRVAIDGAMLGGTLVLDATGRVFLLVMALLWLVTGWLVRPRLHRAGGRPLAVLLLLAMLGGLGMALVGDALLFYAATTLAGYALYGTLVYGADAKIQRAGRVLVILLVLSDLLLFELLLMLGKTAAGMEFAAFRQAFLDAHSPGVMIGLLVGGFGMKMGLLGMHFWLPPLFLATAVALRPALVAYLLGAGLLGGLRLLPLGEITAPAAGEMLWWLAWLTLAYAALAGMLQTHRRSVIAYATIALGGLWLAVLSALLQQPQLWPQVADRLAAALLQSGFALAAVLLLATPADDRLSPTARKLMTGWRWLAVGLLAAVPVGIAGGIPEYETASPLLGAVAVIAFLAASSQVRGRSAVSMSDDLARNSVLPPTAVLTTAALWAAVTGLAGVPFAETGGAALIALVSILLAVVVTRPLIARLPSIPCGDLLVCVAGAQVLAHRLSVRATRWVSFGGNRIRALGRRLMREVARLPVEHWEAAITHWPIALVLALLLGGLMVVLTGA